MTIQKRVQDLFNRFNVDLKVTSERIDMAEATLENGTVIYTDADSFLEGAEAYIINDEGEQIALPEGDYELADGDILQIVEGGKVGGIKKAEGKGDGEGEGKGAAKGPRKGVNPKSVSKPKVEDDAGSGDSGGDGEAGKGGGGKGSGGGGKKKKGLSADENTTDMDDTKQEYVESYVTREIVEEMIREAVASMMGDKKEEDMEEVVEEVKEEMSVNPEAPKGHSEEEAPAEEPAIEMEIEVELEEEPAKEELSKAQSEIEFLKTQLSEIKKQAATKGVQRMAPTQRTEPVDLTNLTTQERVRALANQFSSNNG